jgi:hypothetical protein
MGLISWIKGKYYDSRLDKADRLISENNLDKAEEILRSLLGKQDLAIVHLANMFVSHSQGVEGKLSALKNIVELQDYSNEQNRQDYEGCLTAHLNNIESLANDRFRNESYHDAVLLIDAIQTYRKQNTSYDEKRHRYHAYLAFSKSQQTSHYDQLINEVTSEIKQYERNGLSDIKSFVNLLKSKNRYSRIIKLLMPFLSLDKDFKKVAIESIINVVSKKDSDIPEPKRISEFCSDPSLCKDAANELITLSASSAKKSDYKNSVLFDTFASEYYSSDNQFNNTRCIHILEELSERADANEIKQLLKTAKDLKLTDAQIDSLKVRIAKIADATNPEASIKICRLFVSEKSFDHIYIKKAEKLVASGNLSKINEAELKDIIRKNSDEDSFVDVLSPFVSIPSFEKLFFDAAISKIQRHKSTSFLEKYWKVKENPIFFEKLISPASDLTQDVVKFVSDKHKSFLHSKEFRTAFCKSLDSLNNNSYAYSSSEYLVQKKCDVNSYYVTVALKEAKNRPSTDALSIINHSLSVISDSKLIDRKKQIIRQLINEGDFELSEREAKSLVGVDDEAETLFAELYYHKGKKSTESVKKKECYYQVLDLCESGNVNSSFNKSKEDVLGELITLSKNAYESNWPEAYEILDRIKGYTVYWLPLFIELRNRDFASLSSLGQRIRFAEESISKITGNVENTKDISDSSYFELWDSYLELIFNKAKAQPKDKAIDNFIKVRTLLNSQCNQEYAKERVANLTKEIVKLEWSFATELEADIEYDKAVDLYEAIKSENLPSYNGRAELRSLICSVKAGNIDSSKEQRISTALNLKSHESLKDDLAYRYACYLLQTTRPADAERLLKNYLPNESTLLDLCNNIYIKESEKYLLDFNRKIKTVIEGTMTVAEAALFLQEIDNYKSHIANRLTDTSSKFSSYKGKLESYILRGMFNEEQYEKVFDKLLSMYPNYIEDDSQFHNVAIAALGVVESGSAKEKALKYAISIWLSAVYTDRLFVKSLDYTSWDDDFTFTLQGSLGQTNDYDYDSLPDNINFDTPVDNHNIAIKDVQDSLSSRMETFVRDHYPKYEEFFTAEKDALDNLIELNLDQECIIASPYLANQLSTVRKSIKEALDYDISQSYENEENALDLGVRYGFSGNEYSSYSDAQQRVEKCKTAMGGSVTTIRSAFSSLPQIKNYSKLYASLKSFVSSRMNEDIKSKMDYKKFIDVYEIICKAFNEAPLSLAFSNYANGEVIQRLNADTMELRDGVGYMVRVYNVAPSSIQVKQNLEGMLAALAIQAEENNSSADRTVVNNALLNTGNTFKAKVEDARVQASLSVIVGKVNSGSMAKDKALKDVYELYKKNPNNDRICENLVTLCDICIMEYIVADKWGASSVKTILDSLNNNKSSCFKRHNGKLAQSYSQIWNQLPHESRMLMMGLGGYGTTLNDKGRALQAGLDYLKKLGDVRSSGRLGSLGGIFDDLPF